MELVDYVANTPHNTNRTILKQLVNDEKNKAVYEFVEELKKSGQIGCTSAKKTVLFSGTPQKIDADSMGTLYVLTADNLFELTEGQDIYGELVVGENKHSFVLNYYGEIAYIKSRIAQGDVFILDKNYGAPTVAYIENLGGTGFGFMGVMESAGLDLGEISLTLWTEIGGDKPYYITDLSLADHTIPYINTDNAKEAFLRDSLYYRNNDDQVGKAVGFLPMTDGFKAVFFIPLSDQVYSVIVTADSDNVTTSTRVLA